MTTAAVLDDSAWLRSRAEITDLIHGYSYFVRAGRAAEAAELFARNAVYEMRASDGNDAFSEGEVFRTLTGRAAIAEFLAGTTKSGVRICPFIHNVMIEIDGEGASSTCIMNSLTWPAGHETVGEYRDTFRREDGAWRIATRVFQRFSHVPALAQGD